MLQLQESLEFLLSIRAGKKKKKSSRQPVRDISTENRFYGAHSKVSGIRAPGRRHRDMGSSCIVRVSFLWASRSSLALLSARGTSLEFYSSPRYTDRPLCLSAILQRFDQFSCLSAICSLLQKKKKKKITESTSYNLFGEIIVYHFPLFLPSKICNDICPGIIHSTVILSFWQKKIKPLYLLPFISTRITRWGVSL